MASARRICCQIESYLERGWQAPPQEVLEESGEESEEESGEESGEESEEECSWEKSLVKKYEVMPLGRANAVTCHQLLWNASPECTDNERVVPSPALNSSADC